MKIRLTFKTPDVLDQIVDQVNQEYDHAESEELRESIIEERKAFCEKWVRYGEYLEVEMDDSTGECRVVSVDK